MKFAIGSDHGGLRLKEAVKGFLESGGHQIDDVGTHTSDSCDYPEFGKKVAEAVVAGNVDFGILICGTGLGMSMVANKVKGIRAAVCVNEYMALMARAHNNANVLVMGERVIGEGLAESILNAFLSTEFEGDRHQRRISQMETE